MKDKLGICVSTQGCMRHLLGILAAAARAGKRTEVFLTAEGVHLTQDPRFTQVVRDAGKVWVCEVSYLALGYKGAQVPGLGFKDFSNQMRNADMVGNCERYIIL